MKTQVINPAEVEARTQELGQQLYRQLRSYHPSTNERLQDWLMALLMEDTSLRTRLLRFVDVLAALPEDRRGHRTAALFREYFRDEFPGLPLPVRLALAAARSPQFPDPILAWSVRHITQLIASPFIVPPGPDTIGQTVQQLGEGGRNASFDLLGEEVVSEAEARQYRQAYLDLIDRLARSPQAGSRTAAETPCLEVSLKLSSLTSQFNPADPEDTLRWVRPALEEIFQSARERDIGVTVDAEQYPYRELIWYIFRQVLAPGEPLGQWPDAGMVVQAYLKDAEAHTREVSDFVRYRETPFRIRLVKGAYWDYEVIVAEQNGWPVPVYKDKAATDLTYQNIVRLLLEETPPIKLAVGSHNVRSHAYAEAVREAVGQPGVVLEHQILYRTWEALSSALPQMGWVTRDYVPVGELIPGMAYLVRRILENTSQVGFLTQARLDEEAPELLAPPQLEMEDQSYRGETHPTGFNNTPVFRLFDATERQQFQQALAATRSRWGASYPLRLGSEVVEKSTPLPSTSPSHPESREPIGWVHQAEVEEADRAISLANDAVPMWSARPLEERVAIGLRTAEILKERKDEVAAWVVHEGGRNWPEAQADVEEAIDHITWNALEVRRLAPLIKTSYRPRGVVACIPPWNFPSALPAAMTSAALTTGNTVILKSAEQTPIVAQVLVDAFHAAGVPKEALIHLPGPGETVGARLVESPDVDMMDFTGSKKVGLWIYRTAASVAPSKGGIKQAVTEMGGKNAIIVFPDADMDEAVLGILYSAFGHAGQKCSACSRVLVHREVYDRLARRLVEAARSLPVGPADDPGTVINPVINTEAREGIVAAAEAAQEKGRVLLDALRCDEVSDTCLGPLILEVAASDALTAEVAQEEIFGPVLPLIPFQTEDEAVSIVNSTVYGLTLGIYSRSPDAIARMVRACRAGNIYVNRGITGSRVGIEPFGGFQLSGTGPKTGGEDYLLAFLTRQSGFRSGPETRHESFQNWSDHNGTPAEALSGLRPWDTASAAERLQRVTDAAKELEQDRQALAQAIAAWKAVSPEEAASLVERMLEVVSTVLAGAPEISGPQPTVEIPGETNFVRWDTPRGVGIKAVDEGSDPAILASLIFGPLLAGNGLLIATSSGPERVARVIAECLIRSGVPREVAGLAPPGASLTTLAASPIHFAAVDLALGPTRDLYRTLGVTEEEKGQRWLKALISMSDSIAPGEPGFLRLFAHPKAVAVQTLRHGADLELI
jgi:RHH-type transcriptional regulator, proline utilization regulon repressor / proline dehydrogenase / delta 1-pyrroline-5-carboxylate dehydrogenase